MTYFLFFFWLIVLSWLLTKIRFVKNAGLAVNIIVALFICKVAVGVLSGWLSSTDINSDSWSFHRKAFFEFKLLFIHPKDYFTNLFYTGYSYGYDGILQTQNSYWNDLKDNLIIKFISVLNLFTGGRYYVNVVLYNFIVIFGCISLYKVFAAVFKANRWLTIVLVFLLPSAIFYGSSIHKDGLVFMLLGFIVYKVWQSLNHGITVGRIAWIIVSLLLVFFFRNFIVMAMLPALAAWVLAEKRRTSPILTFVSVYAICSILFFASHYVSSFDLPQYFVQKQADFIALPDGNTTIHLTTLNPTPISFLKVAPQAIGHGLLRPLPTDISLSIKLLPLSIELILYEILLLLFVAFRRCDYSLNRPFPLFALFAGVSLCIIIGYTVPVIGAIVRYRSLFLPFILTPFVLGTDWNRMATFAKIKK